MNQLFKSFIKKTYYIFTGFTFSNVRICFYIIRHLRYLSFRLLVTGETNNIVWPTVSTVLIQKINYTLIDIENNSFSPISRVGYTERRFAGWCRQVGWDAAWRWLVEIPPASFAGSPRAVHSHNPDRQTPCSAEKEKNNSRWIYSTLTCWWETAAHDFFELF